jgi:SAM-dependent methyltransferase
VICEEDQIMTLKEWVALNRRKVAWAQLVERWDRMQTLYNPHRDEQIEMLYCLSGVASLAEPRVLDLGCGPGSVTRYFKSRHRNVHIVGIDADPFLLEMARQCGADEGVTLLEADFRQPEWAEGRADPFDAVVSLTALHWLSQERQREIYRKVHAVLKPGGIFLNGDHYDVGDAVIGERLRGYERDKAAKVAAETWDQYWKSNDAAYGLRELREQFWKSLGPFEGCDDGYSAEFYISALREAGFPRPAAYWQVGRRIIYGGIK